MSQQLNNDDVKEHCHINYDLILFSLFSPTQYSLPDLKSQILQRKTLQAVLTRKLLFNGQLH